MDGGFSQEGACKASLNPQWGLTGQGSGKKKRSSLVEQRGKLSISEQEKQAWLSAAEAMCGQRSSAWGAAQHGGGTSQPTTT